MPANQRGAAYACGGSGQTGADLEVAGGLRVARGVFRVEGMGRRLALHAVDGYREHGATVTLSVGDGARQPGLSLPASGLLTPFGIYGQSQYGRRLQVGLLLSRIGPVGLEVSGKRSARLHPGRAAYRMSALGSITFGGADNTSVHRAAVPKASKTWA